MTARLGHHALNTTNTKHDINFIKKNKKIKKKQLLLGLYTANITHATRASPAST